MTDPADTPQPQPKGSNGGHREPAPPDAAGPTPAPTAAATVASAERAPSTAETVQAPAAAPETPSNGRRQLTTNQALTIAVTLGLGLFLYLLNHVDNRFEQVDAENDAIHLKLTALIAHLGATQAVEDAVTGNVNQLGAAPASPAGPDNGRNTTYPARSQSPMHRRVGLVAVGHGEPDQSAADDLRHAVAVSPLAHRRDGSTDSAR